MRAILPKFVLSLIGTALSVVGFADDNSWIGPSGVTAQWNNGSNWSLGTVPSNATTVTLGGANGSYNVVLPSTGASVTAVSYTNNAYTLDLNGGTLALALSGSGLQVASNCGGQTLDLLNGAISTPRIQIGPLVDNGCFGGRLRMTGVTASINSGNGRIYIQTLRQLYAIASNVDGLLQVNGGSAVFNNSSVTGFLRIETVPVQASAWLTDGEIILQNGTSATVGSFWVGASSPQSFPVIDVHVAKGLVVESSSTLHVTGPTSALNPYGRLQSFGTTVIDGAIINTGEILVKPGGTLSIGGAVLSDGLIDVDGGTLTAGFMGSGVGATLNLKVRNGGSASFTNGYLASGNQVSVSNSTMSFSAGANNKATIAIDGASQIDGSIDSTESGKIDIAPDSTVLLTGAVANNGLGVVVGSGGQAIYEGAVTGAADFAGPGTHTFAGSLSPGNSPAQVSVEGDAVFASTNTLKVELAGISAGTQFDVVAVAGEAWISGALDVKLLNGFTPALGNTFDILTAASVVGTFDSSVLPALGPGLAWQLQVLSTGVRLRVIESDSDGDGIPDANDNCTLEANPTQLDADADGYGNRCDADLNNSGTVTTADFGLLRSVLGQPASASATAAAADMNGSGTVTTADFGLLRARLGTAPGPAGPIP